MLCIERETIAGARAASAGERSTVLCSVFAAPREYEGLRTRGDEYSIRPNTAEHSERRSSTDSGAPSNTPPLSRRSPLPRPPAPPAGPLFSRHAPKSVYKMNSEARDAAKSVTGFHLPIFARGGFQPLLAAPNLCSSHRVLKVRPSRSPPAAEFRGNRTLSALAGVRPSTRGPPASHPKLVPNRRSTAKTQAHRRPESYPNTHPGAMRKPSAAGPWASVRGRPPPSATSPASSTACIA